MSVAPAVTTSTTLPRIWVFRPHEFDSLALSDEPAISRYALVAFDMSADGRSGFDAALAFVNTHPARQRFLVMGTAMPFQAEVVGRKLKLHITEPNRVRCIVGPPSPPPPISLREGADVTVTNWTGLRDVRAMTHASAAPPS